MIKRITLLLNRNIATYKLGLPFFFGMSRFKMPTFVRKGKKTFLLSYPSEDIATARLVFTEVFLDDCYNLGLIEHPIKKAIDIGANMGFSSLCISMAFQPELLVIYEPNPILIPTIEKNLSHVSNLFIENKAVGKENGKANLVFTERENCVVSALTKTMADPNGNTEVISFSEIVEEHGGFDLVKMDCEGGEWSFLNDSSWSKIKYLTMEYHLSEKKDNENKDALYQALNKNFIIIREHAVDSLTGMILAINKSL